MNMKKQHYFPFHRLGHLELHLSWSNQLPFEEDWLPVTDHVTCPGKMSTRPLSIYVCFLRHYLSYLKLTGSPWSHAESLAKTERHSVWYKALYPTPCRTVVIYIGKDTLSSKFINMYLCTDLAGQSVGFIIRLT